MRLAALSLMPLALAACQLDTPRASEEVTGASLYADYCASCHGLNAKGGQVISGVKTADLTQLSARNKGAFPARYVMSTIDGYARDDTHGPMPRFGELLDGAMGVWVDDKGVETPTPQTLILLADFLESQQS